MKKIASLVVVSILMLCSLTACAEKFDASGYVKAVLDNGYYNDSTGIIAMELSTAEEAEAVYNKGVESLVDVAVSAINVSEELEEEYRQFYKDLFMAAKYSVGEAVEVDKTTFEVPVTCEKLNVFAAAIPLLFPNLMIFYLQARGKLVTPSERKNPPPDEMEELEERNGPFEE